VQPQGLQAAPGPQGVQPQNIQGPQGTQPRQFGRQQQPGGQPGAAGTQGVPPQQFGRQPGVQPGGPGPQLVQPQQMLQPQGIASVDALRSQRRQRVEAGGRVVIEEPGNRFIVREQGRAFIRHDETQRFRIWGGPARMEVRGPERYAYVGRPGGYQVITVTDGSGRLLRRMRRGPDGREIVLIDNRPRFGVGAAVGVGIAAGVLLGLAAPVITIPRERYIVDTSVAPAPLLYETLEAAPLVDIERPYSLDEVRYNVALRDRMRRVDIDLISFDSGSWEVTPDQQERLQAIAEAMAQVLARNPDEVFLIEGHTDAVGNEDDNLSLSDRRAESVAVVLTQAYQIPPENLTTQGYGEQHLKVPTDGPSRANRIVVVRRITPLLQGGVASR
jgi:OmpA-OmpF porin, OOP family